MPYVVAGFLGVVLGAVAAAAVGFLFFQRLTDRDLLERRLRALYRLREDLGMPPGLASGGSGVVEPDEVEQLLHNFRSASAEYRLISWVFEEPVRASLTRSLLAFEEELSRARGRAGDPSAVKLTDAYRQLDVTLRGAASRGVNEFLRWRAWPFGRAKQDAPDTESSTLADADADSRRQLL